MSNIFVEESGVTGLVALEYIIGVRIDMVSGESSSNNTLTAIQGSCGTWRPEQGHKV